MVMVLVTIDDNYVDRDEYTDCDDFCGVGGDNE